MQLSLSSLVRLTENQLSATVDGEVIILSMERGTYFGLDEIGSDIWRQMEAPVRVDALCDALAQAYDADPETIRHDVIALLNNLVAENLVAVVG